ncbi:MAG: glycosyltransferase [Bacteroidaceae bacterium]|nr:glycosyltransferase [Bacteroidaceae bacterium]
MTKQFSIIVPVYNVEKYIRDCFESIFSQEPGNREATIFIMPFTPLVENISIRKKKLVWMKVMSPS